ncbi:D-cysteine desulfhydrase family protein [Corynebacterium sp. CNJ-954]|uniref:D-cysteine desulfhydrase family protein n=1 Tax=Corynebacterium sp. CNJ-954 TaxID=1904962 RepID=UPI00096A6076|nr:D-cysteine desulfhydrase family protein [Corynebacterium sp. CNJ-954]
MSITDDKASLGCYPTPVHPLGAISAQLEVNLMIKRDDLSGIAAGGNKIRKLEFLVEDAKRKESTILITAGAIQSNHALQTAAAARKSGLEALLVLDGKKPQEARGNLLLDIILGAQVEYLNSSNFVVDAREYMERRSLDLTALGENPYIIPVGGSNSLGALGYVDCARELKKQFSDMGRGDPDFIVAPVGSAGTYAGLVVGCATHFPSTKILGIVVTTNYFARRDLVAGLVNETARRVGLERTWSSQDLLLDYDFIGPGYGIPSEEGSLAIDLLARSEGIFLDPTYTAKVFAGILGNVASGHIERGADVIFLHTGGAAALLA